VATTSTRDGRAEGRLTGHCGAAREGRDHLRRCHGDNAGGASASGPVKAKTWMPFGNLKYAQWGGQACNPYDTTRDPRGTSNGSGVSVAANLVACSICEQGSASCKGPASRNNVVNLLTTKES